MNYNCGKVKKNVSYTVKLVDENGEVQKDAAENDLSIDGKVTVDARFFKKLFAYVKWIFNMLPKVDIKPDPVQ